MSSRLHTSSLVLSIIGLLNAAYLSWTRLANTSIYCGPGSSACDAVSNSIYGQIMGIPVAYLGLVSYLGLIALLLLENRSEFLQINGPIAVFGLALVGTLFSGYLQYTSIFILREICPYCVVNAVIMLTLLIISILRLRQSLALSSQ